jgi:hypothetical protein
MSHIMCPRYKTHSYGALTALQDGCDCHDLRLEDSVAPAYQAIHPSIIYHQLDLKRAADSQTSLQSMLIPNHAISFFIWTRPPLPATAGGGMWTEQPTCAPHPSRRRDPSTSPCGSRDATAPACHSRRRKCAGRPTCASSSAPRSQRAQHVSVPLARRDRPRLPRPTAGGGMCAGRPTRVPHRARRDRREPSSSPGRMDLSEAGSFPPMPPGELSRSVLGSLRLQPAGSGTRGPPGAHLAAGRAAVAGGGGRVARAARARARLAAISTREMRHTREPPGAQPCRRP